MSSSTLTLVPPATPCHPDRSLTSSALPHIKNELNTDNLANGPCSSSSPAPSTLPAPLVKLSSMSIPSPKSSSSSASRSSSS